MTDDIGRHRAALHQEASRWALDILERSRPHWTDKTWWGQPCPTCGEVRPAFDRVGCMCKCERPERARLAEEYVQEHRAETAERMWADADIPSRYLGCGFDTFEPRPGTEKALEAVRAWVDGYSLDSERGLFLAGPFGSGKTHLAVAALHEAVTWELAHGLFVSAAGLVSKVRKGERLDWQPVELACGVDLLLLDDVGQEAGSDFTRDIVARVITSRYDESMPTIMTTNLGPQALTKALGGGVTSRIHEMCTALTLTATDYRRNRGLGVA